MSDDDEDEDGSRALAAAFQNTIHHNGMSGDPRDINDSLTRGETPALVAGPTPSPGFVPPHREDVFTSSTPGATDICFLSFSSY